MLDFIGRDQFEGIIQEFKFEFNFNMINVEVWEGLFKMVNQGFFYYLVQFELVEYINFEVSFLEMEGNVVIDFVKVEDFWDYWIFEVLGNGWFYKEFICEEFSVDLGVDIDWVIDIWWVWIDGQVSYVENQFESDDEMLVSV